MPPFLKYTPLLLLITQGFNDATGGYFSIAENYQEYQTFDFLIKQRIEYNIGALYR